MKANERFSPAEQTSAQRQTLLDAAQALGAAQGLRPLSSFGQRLYRRYVTGELSLAECRAQLRQRYYSA